MRLQTHRTTLPRKLPSILNPRTKSMVEVTGLSIFVISAVMPSFSGNHSFSKTAAQPLFLADKHELAGIGCEGCHKESPSKKQVPTMVCQRCHGDQTKLAEQTKNLIPNPHQSHLGDIKCELCHHSHKPSEDYCGHCHDFGYKVP